MPGTVPGAGGTEMSKTRFLPTRSSQSTEGERHRNKQSQNSVAHECGFTRGLNKGGGTEVGTTDPALEDATDTPHLN